MDQAQNVETLTIGVAATLVKSGVAVRTDTVSMCVSLDFITRAARLDKSIADFTQALAAGLSFGAHVSYQRDFAAIVAGFIGKSDGFQQIIAAGLDGAWLQIHHDGKGHGRAILVGGAERTSIDAHIETLRKDQLDPSTYSILVGSEFGDLC